MTKLFNMVPSTTFLNADAVGQVAGEAAIHLQKLSTLSTIHDQCIIIVEHMGTVDVVNSVHQAFPN